jgi:hypothetical protein
MGRLRPKPFSSAGITPPHWHQPRRVLQLPESEPAQPKVRELITVKFHCSKLRHLWRAACAGLGVTWNENHPAHEHGEPDEHGHCQTVTFLCVGTAAAMHELGMESFVVRRQNVISATVPIIGLGTCPKKPRKSKRRKRGKKGEPPVGGGFNAAPAVDTKSPIEENDEVQ